MQLQFLESWQLIFYTEWRSAAPKMCLQVLDQGKTATSISVPVMENKDISRNTYIQYRNFVSELNRR